MNNIQVNGQRRWGPPENWSGSPPVHGTEIFVKNLPEDVFEQELYSTFSEVGSVYEVRLPVNWNGRNRGYAFLRFTSLRDADAAILAFDGFEIRRDRKIKVTRSVDNTRLFLSAVPIEKNAQQLKNDLIKYVENVKKVYVYPTLDNSSVYRGYAFVEFETHRDAAIAKRTLTPDVCSGIFEKKCVAAWANPLPFLDHSVLKSLTVLFIRNIPKDIKGTDLKKMVENLIGEEIKRVKKLNDYAFLTFKDHKSAERALHYLQSVPFLIPNHETQAEWAIPREMASSTVESEFGEFENSQRRCERLSLDVEKRSNALPAKAKLPIGHSTGFANPRNYKEVLHSNDQIKPLWESVISGSMRQTESEMTGSILGRKQLKPMLLPSQKQNRIVLNSVEAGKIENQNVFPHSAEFPAFRSSVPRKTLKSNCSDKVMTKSLQSNARSGRKSSETTNFFGKFVDNFSPTAFSRSIGSVDSTQGSSFFQNYSPDSDNGSKDSEDYLLNINRLDTSYYSPLSPSIMTNRSLGSPIQAFSPEERDMFSQSLFEDFYPRGGRQTEQNAIHCPKSDSIENETYQNSGLCDFDQHLSFYGGHMPSQYMTHFRID